MRTRALNTPMLVGTRRDHRNEPVTNRRGEHVGLYKDHVEDAERWCTSIVENGLKAICMHVTREEKEDLIADVLALLLKLEKNFDPERNASFAGYAAWICSRRFIDLAPRALLGRAGGRIAQRDHEEYDEQVSGRARHLTPLPEEPGHADQDQRPGTGRLERDRARLETWADTILGLRAA